MLEKLFITICEMIILTHKKKSDFYIKYWWRYSTLKIPNFKGMDNANSIVYLLCNVGEFESLVRHSVNSYSFTAPKDAQSFRSFR